MGYKIIHLGLGRFHRAHQAVYFQKLNANIHVTAFSMRSPEVRDQLRTVQNRYPVLEIAKDKTEVRWIDCIRESYFVGEDEHQLWALFASPEVHWVTLTVTEKAYVTAGDTIRILVEGLKHRQAINLPLTVLSCDNLRENGSKLKELVLNAASADLKIWIEKNVSFPNTMVDRIVPALDPEKVLELQKQNNINNPELLATETFSQWVIEDNFKTERPALEKVGVQFVKDVRPFEEMKLRLLNASHSLIAYAGLIKGYSYVHEAIRDAEILAKVKGLYSEVIPLLEVPVSFNVEKYVEQLINRFDNPLLPHQLRQIAMDGSQKLPQRILPSKKIALEKNILTPNLDAALDAWAKHCFTQDINDPLKEKILELKKSNSDFKIFKAALLNLI